MIRRSMVLVTALLACLPLTGSAGKANQDAKAAAAAQAASNDVVVKVLGEAVTEKQILNTINQIARSQQQATPEQLKQKDVVFYKDALETLIGAILLKNEGKEKNITLDKAKVDQTFQSVKGQFQNDDAFQKAMQSQGLDEAGVRKTIEDGVLIQQVLDLALKDLPPITDAEIQKFYDDNPKYFEEPEQFHAAHIFLKVDKTATPEQKAEIKKNSRPSAPTSRARRSHLPKRLPRIPMTSNPPQKAVILAISSAANYCRRSKPRYLQPNPECCRRLWRRNSATT